MLGKHSGRAAFRSRLSDLGYTGISDEELNRSFVRFKELADKKKEISNADIESLLTDEIKAEEKVRYQLNHIQVLCGDKQISTATVKIIDRSTGDEKTTSCTGTGPVDAAFKAIIALTHVTPEEIRLLEYTVSSVTEGIDALGEITVRLRDETSSRIAIGRSSNTDVVVASAIAYTNALNRLISQRGEEIPTHPQFNSL